MNSDLNIGCSIEVNGEVIEAGISCEKAFETCIGIAEAMHEDGNIAFVKMFLPNAVKPTFETEGHTFDRFGKCSCGLVDKFLAGFHS
jgi:hypothetical protein